jgi:SAM-dependent methyltransferase
MWDSPIYKLNQPIGVDHEGSHIYKQIVIDVTNSAPPFDSPGKILSAALDQVLTATGLKKTQSILDFGGGKLRNTIHLLEHGYHVCAVEYKSLFDESQQASAAWKAAKRHRTRFSTLLYPHQFAACQARFDLALLINVLNIMPVPAERLLVLDYCHRKLRRGGHLLWYTQRGDADYAKRQVPEFEIGDGHYIGRGSKYKTFYREFTVSEIDNLLSSAGFEFVQAIKASARNQARLYKRLGNAPLAGALTPAVINAAKVEDKEIPEPRDVDPSTVSHEHVRSKGNPDPDALRPERLLIQKLQKIAKGPRSAKHYQIHVKVMLEALFSPNELRRLTLELTVSGGLKRLDILAHNKADNGFFHSVSTIHHIPCPWVVIECKNYRHEIGNPEFDQLGGRLGRKLGRLGILAYRSATKRKSVIARCREVFNNDDKVLLPLDDSDFESLLKLKMARDADGIEAYLDRILLEVKAGAS